MQIQLSNFSLLHITNRPILLGYSLLWFGLVFFAADALCDEVAVPSPAETVPVTPIPDSFDVIEPPRDYLSAKITSYANSIDRFFGGDRHYQEANDSVFQLDLTKVTGFGGDRKYDFGAKLNLRLPVTEGKLHLLLETDPEKNIRAEPTPGSSVLHNKVVVPKSVALAARYSNAKENVWHLSTDGGLKFPIPIKPFVRARASYSAPIGKWQLKIMESVYWFNTLGAGVSSQFDFDRVLSPQLLLRSSSNAIWSNDKKNFDLRQDFSVYHTVNDRSALLYQASVIGVSNPQYQVSDYVLLVFYRYRMHQKWLYLEVSPQLHFPREKNYQYSPAISMRLEALFDDSR
jgi:hypothetical protein